MKRGAIAPSRRAVVVVSGIPGAGKSTIAAAMARHFERGVHLEADALQRFIVSGGLWPDGRPEAEAARQLRLRGRNAALLADSFFDAGFTVVIDDVVIGSRLAELRGDLRSQPLYFVLLVPSLETLRERNAGRPDKDVFETWKHLDAVMRSETERIGMWLDSSQQRPE